MGRVVNKSFNRVRKDIFKKAEKILFFLESNIGDLQNSEKWTIKQNNTYDKLSALCFGLTEEVDNLDEVEVPDFEKK
jgi:hypothetical protein